MATATAQGKPLHVTVTLATLAGAAFLIWSAGCGKPADAPPAAPSGNSAASSGGPGPGPGPDTNPPADNASASSSDEGSSVRRVRWADVSIDAMPGTMEKLAKAGKGVYEQQCLVCHGAEGKGDGPAAPNVNVPPRNFTTGKFKFKTSAPEEMPWDDDLYRTVSSGIPAAGMPSFGDLTPFERWAAVAYVKTLTKVKTDEGEELNFFEARPPQTRVAFPKPPEKDKVDLARGAQLYKEVGQCLKCHGEKGQGDGPSAATLVDAVDKPILPADLTRGEVTFKTGSDVSDVYRVLTAGMAGTPMPSFADLGEADLWNLSYYVTSLFRPIAPGEKLYLRVGCTSCHTVGKGKLIGPDLAGVMQRREEGWLKKWLKDPPSMIATDPEARKLLEEYLTPMPSYGLSDKEVDLLVQHLKTLPPAK